ncbi:Cysteine-rich membrane protein 2 [Spironucleus salmonicida]|uniref:Cysteine-rich membrane protein 2 n=1 Tax=Spironucleus salmonicida TaxID=348837 RepID=V6LMJ9_9EUKA|nr:Cysteine-rich membrane protein 2 [Spironucleus salmonicida]|eukprot:EST41939.1 Cysteine-rich membrane protein 2 [Spironucleus salmonicida]
MKKICAVENCKECYFERNKCTTCQNEYKLLDDKCQECSFGNVKRNNKCIPVNTSSIIFIVAVTVLPLMFIVFSILFVIKVIIELKDKTIKKDNEDLLLLTDKDSISAEAKIGEYAYNYD